MGPPAFYTKVLNYMKVGQHYYSTLYKGQEPLEPLEPLELSMVIFLVISSWSSSLEQFDFLIFLGFSYSGD